MALTFQQLIIVEYFLNYQKFLTTAIIDHKVVTVMSPNNF